MTFRTAPSTVPVDLASVRAYGVERWHAEFSWPVSDVEYLRICRTIEDEVAGTVQRLSGAPRDALLVACNLLVFEYEHFLHAVRVLDVITHAGQVPMVDDRSPWYAPLIRGSGPYLRTSRIGAPSVPFAQFLAPWKEFFRSASYNARSMRKLLRWACIPSGHAVTIGVPTSTIARYCSRTPYALSIRYAPFCPRDVRTAGGSTPAAALADVASRLVERVAAIARANAVVLSPTHRAALVEYTRAELCSAVALLDAAARVWSSPRYAHFFTGYIRDPAQRAIAIAVRRHGGRVTSFTHGGSLGFFDSPTFQLSEFMLSDTFVAYTEESAKLFSWIHARRPNPLAARVTFASSDDMRFAVLCATFAKAPPPARVRRVLYIGDSHAFWRRSLGNARFSLMHLDLERRLCALLIRNGYEVVYKAHPDHAERIRPLLADLVPVRTEDFSQVLHEADAYLFGNVRTTAFPIALCTNKPVIGILLEDERSRVHPEAFAALCARCAMIPAHFDERQRIIVHEDKLLAALAATPRQPDMAFVERYMIP